MPRVFDLTNGPIARGIVLFALPLLGASVIQQLYSTVDLLFVGNVLGTQATAALGVGSLLITCLVGLFSGISVGANVRVANLVGAGDQVGAIRSCRMSLLLGLFGGFALVLAGEALANPFVVWMEIPPDAAADALIYLQFAVAASLPIAVYNTCAGALRGLGDSRSPLLAQLIGGLFNIGANGAALCVFELGIAGCALATFLSNAVAAFIAAAILLGTPEEAKGRGGWIDWEFGRFVLLFGLPIAAQTLAITVSNVVVQHQVDLLGVEAVAAFAIYLKVELPIYFPILAMGQAATTFVAQNDGAGKQSRCVRGVRVCQVICLILTVALSAMMLAVGPWAFGLFDRDEAVVSLGLAMIGTTFPFYFFYAVLEVQADAIRGYGHSLAPALAVLFNICVLRIVLVLALGVNGSNVVEVAMTYPITWFTAMVSVLACKKVMRIG